MKWYMIILVFGFCLPVVFSYPGVNESELIPTEIGSAAYIRGPVDFNLVAQPVITDNTDVLLGYYHNLLFDGPTSGRDGIYYVRKEKECPEGFKVVEIDGELYCSSEQSIKNFWDVEKETMILSIFLLLLLLLYLNRRIKRKRLEREAKPKTLYTSKNGIGNN